MVLLTVLVVKIEKVLWQVMLKFRGLGIVYCYAAFSNIAAAVRLDITVAV